MDGNPAFARFWRGELEKALVGRMEHEIDLLLPEPAQHQAHLLELLHQAWTANLNRKAVPVEFFRLLKLRVGEALEFVVVHQQRHVQQALLAAGLE